MSDPPALNSSTRRLPRSVFLVGAQATGKTTLFRRLRAEFPGSPAVEETAGAEMRKRGWTGLVDTGTDENQKILFDVTVQAEEAAASGEEGTELAILADRCALCCLACGAYGTGEIPQHLLKELLSQEDTPASRAWKRYREGLVILCEPADAAWFEEDGLRGEKDLDEWDRLRRTYREVFDQVGVRYEVLGGERKGLEDRAEWVKSLLGVGS